jgi:hypothetical protein
VTGTFASASRPESRRAFTTAFLEQRIEANDEAEAALVLSGAEAGVAKEQLRKGAGGTEGEFVAFEWPSACQQVGVNRGRHFGEHSLKVIENSTDGLSHELIASNQSERRCE